MEVVASGRGSEEGRRLANIFQQVAADCKVNLQQRFSQYSLPKMMAFWLGKNNLVHIVRDKLIVLKKGAASADNRAPGPRWKVSWKRQR